LAVQGQGKDISCPQCFEINPAGSTFCQLCGAPLGEKGESVEGSDTEVYRELAQTNLLRMRGEYKDAAQVCLSILKRYPHNVTAHALLGDIYAEQGDLEQAAEWYEMALDLSPQAEAERQKLDAIRAKITERQHAATDVQLEIPPAKPAKTGLMITLMAAGILIIGVAAYFMGSAFRDKQAKNGAIEDPIVVTTTGGGTTGETPLNVKNDPGAEVEPKSTDDAILDLLKKTGTEKARYSSVIEFSPEALIVTVTATAEEEPHSIAVLTADDVFANLNKYTKVTTRIRVAGAVVLVADIDRAKLDEIKNALKEGDTLAAHWEEMLTNIRSAADGEKPADTAGGTTGETTTGTATTGGTEGTTGATETTGATTGGTEGTTTGGADSNQTPPAGETTGG
jgi:hypothetical protein